MLRIFLEEEHGNIAKIKITGDFFLYPEENLSKIEENLRGASLDEEKLLFLIKSFLESNPTELYGFAARDLVQAILNCNFNEK